MFLFLHNFVFLNHNEKKFSASTLLNHGSNYEVRSTMVSLPYSCILVSGTSKFLENPIGSKTSDLWAIVLNNLKMFKLVLELLELDHSSYFFLFQNQVNILNQLLNLVGAHPSLDSWVIAI